MSSHRVYRVRFWTVAFVLAGLALGGCSSLNMSMPNFGGEPPPPARTAAWRDDALPLYA